MTYRPTIQYPLKMALLLFAMTFSVSACDLGSGSESVDANDEQTTSGALSVSAGRNTSETKATSKTSKTSSVTETAPAEAKNISVANGESPCDEITETKKKLIVGSSKWRFGTLDPDHPDYCELIELIYDMLIDYLGTDVDMVNTSITFEFKNEPLIIDGVSYGAWTQPSGSTTTITFYNPNA